MADRFDQDRRARFVGMVEAGRSHHDAAAAVGISPGTVSRWLARGRQEIGTEAATFAELVDGVNDSQPTEADVIRLLWRAARKGSVAAMKELLRVRPWDPEPESNGHSKLDELDGHDFIDRLVRRTKGTG